MEAAGQEFVWRFPVDVVAESDAVDGPIDAEAAMVAFAQRQIAYLLDMVVLYEGGRQVRPDMFTLVSRPFDKHQVAWLCGNDTDRT